jgi:hypothetical protein
MKIEKKKDAKAELNCCMCFKPVEEFYICDDCSHTECIECYDGWIEGQHPCRWLQYKAKCVAKK